MKHLKLLQSDWYQRDLVSLLTRFFRKKLKGNTFSATCKVKPVQQLAEELHKPIARRFNKRKTYSFYMDYIWGADIPDIQLIGRYSKRIRFF